MTSIDLSPRSMTFTVRSTSIDGTLSPVHFDHPVLAAELSDALINMRRTFALADGTAYHYRVTIINLLRSLTKTCPRTVSLTSDDRRIVNAFHEWESGLAAAYPAESNAPRAHGGRIRRLIRMHAVSGHEIGDEVARWANGPMLHQAGEYTPLDEFSNAERLAIREVCRTRIRELETRLTVGRRMLEAGQDPRDAGWSKAENVIWGIHYLSSTDGKTVAYEATHACERGDLDELDANFRTDRPLRPGGTSRVVHRLMSYLYPSSADLTAFRTLLQLETGAAPEEWSGVTLGDIQRVEPGVLHIRLFKSRAHRTRTVRCTVSTSHDATGWRSGDLVQRLLAATTTARTLAVTNASPIENAAFLSVYRGLTRDLEVRRESFRSFSSLLRSVEPAVSTPHDARRLRKTVKSVRAAVLKSADLAAGDDHSIAVYQRHYAQSTTVHVLAGAAVNAAQHQVFDRLRGPIFVNAPAIAVQGEDHAELSAAATAELESTSTDRSMNVAHCTSPYKSPYSAAGRLCEHRPSMCFACPNAIVFTDHLPRILAYRDILHSHQNEMPPAQFAATHGQQLRNIERIIDEFTPAEQERAQRDHELHSAVHIPISQRGVHL
ncbi:hypothetical protein [Microbacterium sp. ER1]|uniref:hypothetical protein n=1 Tax=Microbacterium sp. ER1 TaxID=1932846 RepID=UPI00201AD9E4|nr:hypothetical protein [Microbacterium sp. ER1]